jgi:RND family efflux transporter MFP subunit
MRMVAWLGIGAVVAAGGVAGVLTRAPRPAPLPPPTAARAEAPSVTVETAPARDYLGVLIIGQDVDVAPKVEGRVQSIAIKPGDRVRRGAVLAQMDVHAAKAALRLAEASLADAKERLARRSGMVAGVLSQEEISNAQVLVLERRSRVEDLRALIRDADVRAPFDGVVSARFLDPGAIAAPTRPIARLVGGSEVRARFAVPEEQTGAVAAGMHARLRLKALDRSLAAVVTSVAPEVDSAARMTFAVAAVEVPAELAPRLSAGMVGRVTVDAGGGERASAR